MRQKVRVVFALQTYLNDVLIPVAHRLWQCAEEEGLAWRVAVNQDDRRLDLTSAWLRVLEPLGENATLVKSNNVHELRAYNLMARMFDADYIIFLQDDDIPPHDCDWLRRGLRPLLMDSKAGAVGMRVGVLGNERSSTSNLCGADGISTARYVSQVDLAPLIVRQRAFLDVGGFDTSHTAAGLPGIGMDFFLSCQLWKGGWHVLHVPTRQHEFVPRVLSKELQARANASVTLGRSVRNSQGGRRDIQAQRIRSLLRRVFGNETGCFSERALALNTEWFQPCSKAKSNRRAVFKPTKRGFGNCSWPPLSELRGCNSFQVERLIGSYASWNRCADFPQPAADNELVEVTRLLYPGGKWKEGFSTGWLGNQSGRAKATPFGCWFFLAPGSGVYLNVTRTLAVRSREDLFELWELPKRHHTNGAHDAHLCSAARSRGYRTIQISQRAGLSIARAQNRQWGTWHDGPQMSPPELLLCDEDCMQVESTNACPTSTILHQVDAANVGGASSAAFVPCKCNAESPLLSCDSAVHDPCAERQDGKRVHDIPANDEPNSGEASFLHEGSMSVCIARLLAQLQNSHSMPHQLGLSDAVVQLVHKVTCTVLERILRARVQLGALHHVVYLAQAGHDEDWISHPRSVADFNALRQLLGGSRLSVFCLLQLRGRWPEYFGSRLPAWSFSRDTNASSSVSDFNTSIWYWKQCDVPALWWGAVNVLSKAGAAANAKGFWYLEHDVEWTGSLATLLEGHESADHVTPHGCSQVSVSWSHFRERNHLNRTSVFAGLGFVTRLSRKLLDLLVRQLKAGRQHAYCELRACSHARLASLSTGRLNQSSLAIADSEGHACTREAVRGHALSGRPRLFHPCKWD